MNYVSANRKKKLKKRFGLLAYIINQYIKKRWII